MKFLNGKTIEAISMHFDRGARRVGKSTIVEEFASKDSNHI